MNRGQESKMPLLLAVPLLCLLLVGYRLDTNPSSAGVDTAASQNEIAREITEDVGLPSLKNFVVDDMLLTDANSGSFVLLLSKDASMEEVDAQLRKQLSGYARIVASHFVHYKSRKGADVTLLLAYSKTDAGRSINTMEISKTKTNRLSVFLTLNRSPRK